MRKTQDICTKQTSISKIFIICLFLGCSPKSTDNNLERTKNTIDLVQYQQELDKCREEIKVHKSYELYEECAKKADTKVGRKK